MTTLPLNSFDAWVQTQAAALQSASDTPIDLSVGSDFLAIIEANGGVALWMQYLALLILQTTRLATSSGTDVDSFGADFSFTRLPASYATGVVTFGRYVPTSSAFIPTGTMVKTSDGTQSFAVIADTTQAAYSATLGGYSLPAGTSTITATVQAQTIGSAGNVLANTVSLMVSNIANVDYVNNATGFGGGVDPESDAAFRTRFANYINTRSLATVNAVEYAASSVQSGLSVTVQENVAPNGSTQIGNFVVTVDDGSGDPPGTLLSTITTAVNAVRPIGSTFAVFGPTVVSASISMTVSASPGYSKPALQAAIGPAITAYVNALPIGAPLPYSILSKLAYDATPGVANVQSVLLNGGTSDLGGGVSQVVKATTVAVN